MPAYSNSTAIAAVLAVAALHGLADGALAKDAGAHQGHAMTSESAQRRAPDLARPMDRKGTSKKASKLATRTKSQTTKDQTPVPAAAKPAATGIVNTIHPILSPPPPAVTGIVNTIHPIVSLPPPAATGIVNTIHPILSPPPPAATGIVNTIHPIISPPPPAPSRIVNATGTVTVSNGVTKLQLREGQDGLLVKQVGGNIVVSSGGQSVTLPGGSVTVSGAISAGAAAGIQTARQPNGDMTFAAAPPPPQPAPAPAPAPGHVTGGPAGGFFGDLGSSIVDAGKAVGHGVVGAGKAVENGVKDVAHKVEDFGEVKFQSEPTPAATSTMSQQ